MGTFRAADVRFLCRLLGERGIDANALMREAGIDPATLDQPRARFPFDRVMTVFGRGWELAGDPDLGLKAGQAYRPTDFHGLAVSFLASSNFGAGLSRIARYHRVINTAERTVFERDGNRVGLRYSKFDAPDLQRRMQEDCRTSILLHLIGEATNHAVKPVECRFTYPEPPDRRALDELLGCPIVFEDEDWTLWFDAADAGLPFQASNRDLARSYDHILDEVCKSLANSDLVSRVKLAMVEQLTDGGPTEDSIAKAVFLSRRSLQRHLASQGTSFTGLLTDVRRDLAERYVRDPDLPVTEISFMLGFSDVSAFSRAFKRWTGVSPVTSRRSAMAASA